jgi:hypothetical protein
MIVEGAFEWRASVWTVQRRGRRKEGDRDWLFRSYARMEEISACPGIVCRVMIPQRMQVEVLRSSRWLSGLCVRHGSTRGRESKGSADQVDVRVVFVCC